MSFLTSDLSLWMFLAGAVGVALLGGWHCAGMCGVFASFTTRKQDVFFYQLGRLFMYVTLGTLASLFGARILGFVPEELRLFVGVGLMLFALWILLSSGSVGLPRGVMTLFRKARGMKIQSLGLFSMGALNGLLPCHWLYGFLAVAAGLGDPLRGAVLLFALWLGSMPWLLGMASFSAILKRHSRRRPWAPKLFLVLVVASFLVFPQALQLFAGGGHGAKPAPVICGGSGD